MQIVLQCHKSDMKQYEFLQGDIDIGFYMNKSFCNHR